LSNKAINSAGLIGREMQLQKCTEEAQNLVSFQTAIMLVILDGVKNISCLINNFIPGFDVRDFTLISEDWRLLRRLCEQN
jgi:hypothetical protein